MSTSPQQRPATTAPGSHPGRRLAIQAVRSALWSAYAVGLLTALFTLSRWPAFVHDATLVDAEPDKYASSEPFFTMLVAITDNSLNFGANAPALGLVYALLVGATMAVLIGVLAVGLAAVMLGLCSLASPRFEALGQFSDTILSWLPFHRVAHACGLTWTLICQAVIATIVAAAALGEPSAIGNTDLWFGTGFVWTLALLARHSRYSVALIDQTIHRGLVRLRARRVARLTVASSGVA